ncbi:hypothetical protein ACP4OV_006121 [Aristida adscensionis]
MDLGLLQGEKMQGVRWTSHGKVLGASGSKSRAWSH